MRLLKWHKEHAIAKIKSKIVTDRWEPLEAELRALAREATCTTEEK